MTTALFYFTSTGNCLDVANKMKKELGDCNLYDIAKYDINIEVKEDKIGFIFPIYYGSVPRIVENFLNNVKIKKNSYVFVIATYGANAGRAIPLV